MALAYIASVAVLGLVAITLGGCGGTYTIRMEQVPAESRVQWEVDVSDRINKLDQRIKQLEKERTDA